jgi:hypothetical protein
MKEGSPQVQLLDPVWVLHIGGVEGVHHGGGLCPLGKELLKARFFCHQFVTSPPMSAFKDMMEHDGCAMVRSDQANLCHGGRGGIGEVF